MSVSRRFILVCLGILLPAKSSNIKPVENLFSSLTKQTNYFKLCPLKQLTEEIRVAKRK